MSKLPQYRLCTSTGSYGSLFRHSLPNLSSSRASRIRARITHSKHQDDHKARHNQCTAHKAHNNDTSSARRKLSPNNIMLAFKISVKAEQEDQDCWKEKLECVVFTQRPCDEQVIQHTYSKKSCSKWFANVPQFVAWLSV